MLTTESMRSAMWFSFWSLVALTGVHLYILLCLQGPLHIMNYFGMFAVLLMWPDQYKWLRGNVTTRTFHSLFGMSILYLCVIGKDYKSFQIRLNSEKFQNYHFQAIVSLNYHCWGEITKMITSGEFPDHITQG